MQDSVVEKLSRVYCTHRRQLFASALLVTGCPHHAEDAVHNAFAKLFAMRTRPRHLRAYVFRAVRNAAIDVARRASRNEVPMEAAATIYAAGELEPSAALQLAEAMATLRPQEHEVIVLHLSAGLKFREVAAVLDRPRGTIVSCYRRGLEKLREALG